MHLALVGAFPFPFPQGSQVFFAEQARSLAAAGARPTLVCYGAGEGEAPRDLPLVRSRYAPEKLRSGPSATKPFADAALAAALVAAHRRDPFDAVLAHNAEAALAAIAARPWMRRPIVYVAHTVLARELATYAPAWSAPLCAIGARIDAFVARRVDAIVALSHAGETALARNARGPVERIPPALAALPAPDAGAVAAACRRRGLAPCGFGLYAGNLDGYQELATLAEAAALAKTPIVAATHSEGRAPAPIVTVRIDDADEGRLLAYGAAATLLTRRALGGFPIKLLNYMEAARPTIAYASIADPLVHDESGWLLEDAASPRAWAAALDALAADPVRAAKLGAAARDVLVRDHDPGRIAARTLALVERAIARRR